MKGLNTAIAAIEGYDILFAEGNEEFVGFHERSGEEKVEVRNSRLTRAEKNGWKLPCPHNGRRKL